MSEITKEQVDCMIESVGCYIGEYEGVDDLTIAYTINDETGIKIKQALKILELVEQVINKKRHDYEKYKTVQLLDHALLLETLLEESKA